MTVHTMTMPDLGEGVVEAELVRWLVRAGQRVTTESLIAEIMTDKAIVEVGAPVAGIVSDLLVTEGAVVAVGSDLITIECDSASSDRAVVLPDLAAPEPPAIHPSYPEPPAAAADAPAPSDGWPASQPLAAPTVRRRARELGVDIRTLTGTGPAGRIMLEDVEGRSTSPTPPSQSPQPDQTERLRGTRRIIAERLTASWKAPHITYVEDVDVTELERLRAAVNLDLGPDARRLTVLPFIARSVLRACADQPKLNSTYDAQAETLRIHGAVHLGIATQTDRGLVVPVVRGADRLSLLALAQEIHTLADAARNGNADRGQLAGSTITISSLGSLGGIMNTPILNAPEVTVVGINKIETRPLWNGSSFVPRSVMNISASFDHRIVDGWDAAVFVQRIKQLLETPALLTLGWMR
jgi:2-oxoisovalerate dehydrogenase E2 component (dihydrolipoyl transacylase)